MFFRLFFDDSTTFRWEYLRCVQHVDKTSESNKCGFVTATGLKTSSAPTELNKVQYKKNNLCSSLILLLNLGLSSRVKPQKMDVKWCRSSSLNFGMPEVGSFYFAIKRQTLNLSLISLYCWKLIQKKILLETFFAFVLLITEKGGRRSDRWRCVYVCKTVEITV